MEISFSSPRRPQTIDREVSPAIVPGKLSDIDIIELYQYCRRNDDLSLEILLHHALQEGCAQNGIDISSDGPRPSETRQSLSSQNLSEELADALPLCSAHRTRVNKTIPGGTSLTERCGPDACPSVRIESHVPGVADGYLVVCAWALWRPANGFRGDTKWAHFLLPVHGLSQRYVGKSRESVPGLSIDKPCVACPAWSEAQQRLLVSSDAQSFQELVTN